MCDAEKLPNVFLASSSVKLAKAYSSRGWSRRPKDIFVKVPAPREVMSHLTRVSVD